MTLVQPVDVSSFLYDVPKQHLRSLSDWYRIPKGKTVSNKGLTEDEVRTETSRILEAARMQIVEEQRPNMFVGFDHEAEIEAMEHSNSLLPLFQPERVAMWEPPIDEILATKEDEDRCVFLLQSTPFLRLPMVHVQPYYPDMALNEQGAQTHLIDLQPGWEGGPALLCEYIAALNKCTERQEECDERQVLREMAEKSAQPLPDAIGSATVFHPGGDVIMKGYGRSFRTIYATIVNMIGGREPNHRMLSTEQHFDIIVNEIRKMYTNTPWVHGTTSILEAFLDALLRFRTSKAIPASRTFEPFWNAIFWDERKDGQYTLGEFLRNFERAPNGEPLLVKY